MPERRKPKVFLARKSKNEAKKDKVEIDQAMPVRGLEEDDFEEDDWEYPEESDVYLRSKFFESWLWKTVDLPAQADRDG